MKLSKLQKRTMPGVGIETTTWSPESNTLTTRPRPLPLFFLKKSNDVVIRGCESWEVRIQVRKKSDILWPHKNVKGWNIIRAHVGWAEFEKKDEKRTLKARWMDGVKEMTQCLAQRETSLDRTKRRMIIRCRLRGLAKKKIPKKLG